MQVLHVVPSLNDWQYDTHSLDGTVEFGDPKDNSKSWAIKFNNIYFNKYKVESEYKSYSVIHDKDDLFKFKQEYQEEFLADIERIKKCGGANVFIINENENEKEQNHIFNEDQQNRMMVIKARLPTPLLIKDDLKNFSLRTTTRYSLQGLAEMMELKKFPQAKLTIAE